MANTTNRFLVSSQGSPLTASAVPIPKSEELNPTEVLIHLKAVAVNPADYKMIDLGHRVQSWPLVAGLDGAGEIVAIGSKVSRFVIGDGVLAAFATGERTGSYQQYAIIEEGKVAKKPKSWSFEEAAGIAVCYITALVGLIKGLDINPSFLRSQSTLIQASLQSVLVLGGSSAVGAAAVQLLRLSLPQDVLILATSSPSHHRHIEDYLGARKALDRNSTCLVNDVKQATPSQHGVDAIIDMVGAGAGSEDIFDVFRDDGPKRYAQVWTGDEEVSVPEGVESVMFRSKDLLALQDHDQVMSVLETLLEEGIYKLPLPVKVIDGTGLEALKTGLECCKGHEFMD